jgi:chromosome segregation ATPase
VVSRSAGRLRDLCRIALCLILIGNCDAQQAADPQQTAAALARAQGLLRQLGQQKTQLETDNAMLAADLAGASRRLEQATAKLKNLELDLASSERQNERDAGAIERLQSRLEKTTERLREFVEKFKATSQSLAQTQFEKSELEAELARTRAELADAEQKNLALYTANIELLDLYTNKSPLDGILQREPFTGIGKVDVENIREQYEYKMYDEVRDTNLEAARAINTNRAQ